MQSNLRNTTIRCIGQICDVSRFDLWFSYVLFVCRVLAVMVNTPTGLRLAGSVTALTRLFRTVYFIPVW